jgi:hypothetical protein
MDNHPSFETRIADLKKAAAQLRDSAALIGTVAETVMSEVLHMEAAQTRFSARKEQRQTQRASR